MDKVNSGNLIDIWKEIETSSRAFEFSLIPEYRKNTGSYYTGLGLANQMVDDLFAYGGAEFTNNLPEKTFLEPCVGTGNFVFAFLRKVYETGYPLDQVQQILNNIYVCDTNTNALRLYKNLLTKLAFKLWGISLDDNYFDIHIGRGLLYDVNQVNPSYVFLQEVFSEDIVKTGFDIVITNPPYKNLKAEKNKHNTFQAYDEEKKRYSTIAKDVKKQFIYSNDGVLNLYKLFVEKITTDYTNAKAYVLLLVPSSILSDKTCAKLRTHVLLSHKLYHINVIRENNPYINAQQALCTLLFEKSIPTTEIKIVPDYCREPNQFTYLKLEDVLNKGTENSIFSIPSKDYAVLSKLRVFPTIKDIPFIKNLRGELDLTADSNNITMEKTTYSLIRGKNVGYFFLSSDPVDYVEESFVKQTNKKEYISKPRIICQQVVNIHKERRVTFSYIDRGYVLGNSCNFISVEENKYNIDLFCLLGLFNSPIINWFFKLTSTNNHVNNYEIDSFPIPINSPYLKTIGSLTKQYLETRDNTILNEIYYLSYACYGITVDDPSKSTIKKIDPIVESAYKAINMVLPDITLDQTQLLLDGKISFDTLITEMRLVLGKLPKRTCEHIINKFQKIKRGEVFNHTTFKLSNLDLEMAKAVPQGGNWKNIPQATINKSKRLIRIQETGGRTTLYGRMDYAKPSYTITTYFNRPGNGAYIHPTLDRVISVREAARLQSFKDNYFFYGNKTELLKQVGNAVPPLLAYQIGKEIINKTGCRTSLDLFCGAGGLTVGLKESGMNSILGVDNVQSACITFKANNPEIEVICDDITKESVKFEIIDLAKKKKVDLICGGPPCQGFSLAGKRFIDDPRNELFKHFIEIVKGVQPKIVVMENVEGLLTFQGGEIYAQIIDEFTILGYNTEGRLLLAHKYGVPQKRKRVIIICVRNDLNIRADNLFPVEITKSDDKQITAYDAISDLEDIPCVSEAKYRDHSVNSSYVQELNGIRKFGDYVDFLTQNREAEFQQLSIF